MLKLPICPERTFVIKRALVTLFALRAHPFGVALRAIAIAATLALSSNRLVVCRRFELLGLNTGAP